MPVRALLDKNKRALRLTLQCSPFISSIETEQLVLCDRGSFLLHPLLFRLFLLPPYTPLVLLRGTTIVSLFQTAALLAGQVRTEQSNFINDIFALFAARQGQVFVLLPTLNTLLRLQRTGASLRQSTTAIVPGTHPLTFLVPESRIRS